MMVITTWDFYLGISVDIILKSIMINIMINKIKKLHSISIVIIIVVLLIVCWFIITKKSINTPVTSQNAKPTHIVTSFCVVNGIVNKLLVGIDNIKKCQLINNDVSCPHEYSVCPEDIKRLENANIFIKLDKTIDSQFDKIVSQIPNLHVITICEKDGVHDWLSIDQTIKMATYIQSKLVIELPDHKDNIINNLNKYVIELQRLKAHLCPKFERFKDISTVTDSEILSVFLKELGLQTILLSDHKEHDEVSSHDMVKMIQIMRQNQVKLIFTTQNSKTLESLKCEFHNVKICTLLDKWSENSDIATCIEYNINLIIPALENAV